MLLIDPFTVSMTWIQGFMQLCKVKGVSRTASLMMCQVSGTSWSYSFLKARFPGLGAPNVYTCVSHSSSQSSSRVSKI